MMETLAQSNPLEEQFSVEEHDEMVLNALLGSIDDLHEEFQQEDRERSDKEILSAVQGVYTAGSEHYNGELAQTMQLFDQFVVRLGEMACNHDHLMQTALNPASQKHADNDGHNHKLTNKDKEDDEREIGPVGKLRKKK